MDKTAVQFIRVPLSSFEKTLTKIVRVAYTNQPRTFSLLVFDDSFVLFQVCMDEDEFGHRDPEWRLLTKKSDIMSTLSPDDALKFGIVDMIGYNTWKAELEADQEEMIQKSLERDYRQYLEFEKRFSGENPIFKKVNGKWINARK